MTTRKFVYVLFLLPVVWGYSQGFPDKEILNYADSLRTQHKIPELGFAVVTMDGVQLLQVTGVNRYGESDEANVGDRFHLGSNSKAITGYAAGRLVEAGRIKWDDKVADVMPEWKNLLSRDYASITLQDLLSHRAHIQPITEDHELDNTPEFKGTPSQRRKSFSEWLLQQPPATDTTRSFTYSNGGYAIASVLLEKVSGKSWEEMIVEEMEILGIDVGFSFPAVNDVNEPWGHNENLKPLGPDDPYKLPDLLGPAGDLNMTLGDYSKFIQENLKGLKGNSKRLKKKTFEFLHRGIPNYAMGWGSGTNRNGQQVSSHTGSAGTFFIRTYIIHDTGYAYIIAANVATEEAEAGTRALQAYLIKNSPATKN